MFRKNDKYLFIAKIIVFIFFVLGAIGLVISLGYWVYYSLEYNIHPLYSVLAFLGILIGGIIALFVGWIFWCLFFSFLWDVKIIRNSCYKITDSELWDFWEKWNFFKL